MKKSEAYKDHKKLHGENAVAPGTFYNRLDRGRSTERTINTPSFGHGGKRDFPTIKELYVGAKEGKSYNWFIKYLNKHFYE